MLTTALFVLIAVAIVFGALFAIRALIPNPDAEPAQPTTQTFSEYLNENVGDFRRDWTELDEVETDEDDEEFWYDYDDVETDTRIPVA